MGSGNYLPEPPDHLKLKYIDLQLKKLFPSIKNISWTKNFSYNSIDAIVELDILHYNISSSKAAFSVSMELIIGAPVNAIINTIAENIPSEIHAAQNVVNSFDSLSIEEMLLKYKTVNWSPSQQAVIKTKVLEEMTKYQNAWSKKLEPEKYITSSDLEHIQYTPYGPGGFGIPAPSQPSSNPNISYTMTRLVPGLNSEVAYPCKCVSVDSNNLQSVIIHLNDQHHPKKKISRKAIDDPWPRERIADWLESLDVDLEFKTQEEVA